MYGGVEVVLYLTGKVEGQNTPIVAGSWDSDLDRALCGWCLKVGWMGWEVWWSHPCGIRRWLSRACLGQDENVGGEDDGILTAGGRGIGLWWCWSVWLGGGRVLP